MQKTPLQYIEILSQFGIFNWIIQREQKTTKHYKIEKIEYLLIESAFLSWVKEKINKSLGNPVQ